MLKYNGMDIVFGEIPDECTLAFSISNCPFRCKGCHSPHLWEDSGEPLTTQVVLDAIKKHPYATCVLFMGGDSDLQALSELAEVVSKKVAWYSGRIQYPEELNKRLFTYVKLGPYIEEKGPITSSTTNQRMYYINEQGDWSDITYKFWNK